LALLIWRQPNRASARRDSSHQPRYEPDVPALFAVTKHRPKRSPNFVRVAAPRQRFLNVRLEFFIDISIQTITTKDISHPRPQRHVRPPEERD
jgi:hypothetical protein